MKIGGIGMRIKELVQNGMGLSILIICSWMTITMISIPFTMQTFALFLLLYVFHGKRSFFILTTYLLLGLVGIPVFSNFQSGTVALFGPTGGYLFGFWFATLCLWGSEQIWRKHISIFFLFSLFALFICYFLGTLWFLYSYSEAISLSSALHMCVLPFILPDIGKILLAGFIGKRLNNILHLR